jgi:hypothetical protein
MDDNDKIIKLAEILEMKYTGSEFSIDFATTDCDYRDEYGFEPMDTERLLDAAAKLVNMEIVLKGKESARLRMKQPGVSFRIPPFSID